MTKRKIEWPDMDLSTAIKQVEECGKALRELRDRNNNRGSLRDPVAHGICRRTLKKLGQRP